MRFCVVREALFKNINAFQTNGSFVKIATIKKDKRYITCMENRGQLYDIQKVIQYFLDQRHSSCNSFSSNELVLGNGYDARNFLAQPENLGIFHSMNQVLRCLEYDVDEFLPEGLILECEDVKFAPPIVDTPLVFGLAGNCPQTWRRADVQIPNYPVGYCRPSMGVSAHYERIVLPPDVTSFRCAAELGVVIGKEANNVDELEAMDFVFGYTCVNDMISNHWKDYVEQQHTDDNPEFMEYLITSYYGRGTDGFGPIGPWVVSKDEVNDPYNLLMTTKQNGIQRDRSCTSAMVVGIERAVSYLSKFMTLLPGTIIHMGAMGLDGITIHADHPLELGDFVDIEIEKIGTLRTYFDDQRRRVK